MNNRATNRVVAGRALRALLAIGMASVSAGAMPALAGNGMAPAVDEVVDRWVGDGKIVGAVVIVARDGEIVYRRADGFADREAGLPVSRDSIFRLASMTKAIVSATALALVDAGRLSLEDTVAEWLPYFRPRLADGRQPDITIRQLLTHTSGLSYAFLEPQGEAYRERGIEQGLRASDRTLDEVLGRLAGAPLFYAPGREWRYSLSIDVLGGVIEKAADLPLPAAVERYVTGPLDMRDSAFGVVDASRLTAAYRNGSPRAERLQDDYDTLPLGANGIEVSPRRALDPLAWPSGGGGMTGTAGDYLRFLEAIRRGGAPILSEDSARRFRTHAIGELRAVTEGPGWGHGLGAAVLLDPEAAGTPQGKGTWQWGGAFGTHWFVDPGWKLTVVVMTNTSPAGVLGEFPAEIRDALYAGLAASQGPERACRRPDGRPRGLCRSGL